ncbi:MAG TPA: hypothetical protein VE715_15805 [Blastocatellia bacterium]|nr:hypothetical protein [Blastocatellia bacterium]
MAVVRGVQEQVHFPTYDAVSVKAQEQLRDVEPSSTLKFFVNVQGKTKLETNMQSASLLPHYNTFEARAMRVVISDLPPEFPEDPTVSGDHFDVTNKHGKFFTIINGQVEPTENRGDAITASVELGIDRLAELFREAKESDDETAEIDPSDEEEITLFAPGKVKVSPEQAQEIADRNGSVKLFLEDIEDLIEKLGKSAPPIEQLNLNNGSGTIIGKLIYNTVTSFIVGEKTMISMPTWFFPSGAGPYSQTGDFTTHGEPSPLATFRFAEPIYIDKQQNFRVEIEIPDSDTLKEIQKLYGPFKLWVVLDGYLTRDVQ